MPLTWYEYNVGALALAWIAGFVPVFARRPGWTWTRALGLVLVAWPFALMTLGFLDDALRSFQRYQATGSVFQVLQPVPAAALWSSIFGRILFYAVLPLLGLLLLHRMWARDTREAATDIARANGLAARASWRRDVARGLGLFFALALAYLVAYGASTFIPSRVAGADETRYWTHLTLPLIVMLSIVPALTEELLFRGILLRALARRMRFAAAAVVQAALFGLIHAGYGSWTHVLAPFVFGLGMAWIVSQVGWWAAAILHAEVNTLFFVIERWPAYVATNGAAGALALGSLVVLLVGGGVYALWRTRADAYGILWRSLRRPFTAWARRSA